MKYETVAMGIVYRRVAEDIEFLIMRRAPHDGGFWQPVTGSIEEGEDSRQAVIREVAEEAGFMFDDMLHASEIIHYQEWSDEYVVGKDAVYVFEVPHHIDATLSDEHDTHEWLRLEEAVERVKYEGNKASLRKAHSYALGRGAEG